MPKDINEINFKNYKNLSPKWQSWDFISGILKSVAENLSDAVCQESEPAPRGPRP
jgi:hypothetical protein